MSDDDKKWPHTEMPIVGKTPSGHRIAKQADGRLRVLSHGERAVQYHYNGPSLQELSKMTPPSHSTLGQDAPMRAPSSIDLVPVQDVDLIAEIEKRAYDPSRKPGHLWTMEELLQALSDRATLLRLLKSRTQDDETSE